MLMKIERMNSQVVSPELLGEERERQHHVADQHDPRRPSPLAEHAIPEVLLLDLVARQPRDLELGHVGEADDHRRERQSFAAASRSLIVTKCWSLKYFRIGMMIVNTIPMPEKIAPATK